VYYLETLKEQDRAIGTCLKEFALLEEDNLLLKDLLSQHHTKNTQAYASIKKVFHVVNRKSTGKDKGVGEHLYSKSVSCGNDMSIEAEVKKHRLQQKLKEQLGSEATEDILKSKVQEMLDEMKVISFAEDGVQTEKMIMVNSCMITDPIEVPLNNDAEIQTDAYEEYYEYELEESISRDTMPGNAKSVEEISNDIRSAKGDFRASNSKLLRRMSFASNSSASRVLLAENPDLNDLRATIESLKTAVDSDSNKGGLEESIKQSVENLQRYFSTKLCTGSQLIDEESLRKSTTLLRMTANIFNNTLLLSKKQSTV
jgi:hypothetical protein